MWECCRTQGGYRGTTGALEVSGGFGGRGEGFEGRPPQSRKRMSGGFVESEAPWFQEGSRRGRVGGGFVGAGGGDSLRGRRGQEKIGGFKDT